MYIFWEIELIVFYKFNDKALITVINMVISAFAFCGVTAASCFLEIMQEKQGL